ncbi:hypothetical protein BDP81DRAFT_98954 [Colletotrichum phormii]|uniref:Secreted protein n=1 Tax=Colletotrichum phormii TaxID=359342 RepID=A0AAJ0EB11_9PEZI|nr:uncharacterized protein BDP81DRAFT_98954 [Colletotrichum phormii]KAK1625111.1 hypothetical protein BDP81DRAFT_98954 [Colletotrichum phormii]
MMESGVSLMISMVLLMNVTMVVQDVRIASIWTKRDRITTDEVKDWDHVRDIWAATRDKPSKKCIGRWRKFQTTK